MKGARRPLEAARTNEVNMRFIATSALLGIFAAGSAQAADMDAGAALAEKWCSSCHGQ